MNTTPLLLVMAGGTGGHIFPGLAVANYLKNKGWNIHWLGSENGMEKKIIEAEGIGITLLPVSGVRGKGIFKKLLSPFVILRSIWRARICLKNIAPDVVLGMGGFASGPGGVAAKLLNTPLVIHEQNAIAGYTNKLLAQIASKVLAAFPNAFSEQQQVMVVGNPIRKNLCQLQPPKQRLNERQGGLRILVIGGSRGALVLNQVLPKAVAKLESPIELMIQCGSENKAAVEQLFEQNLTQSRVQHKLDVFEFIDDMAAAYGWADCVICRAGALTVSELMAVGLGALFIPFPFAVDDHQTANAQFMVERGAAKIIPQHNFSADSCSEWIATMSRDKAQQMAIAAYDKNSRQVTATISNICAGLLKRVDA